MSYKYDTFICVAPNYYGFGDTPEDAKTNCKKAGGKLNQYVIKNIHPDTEISHFDGSLSFPQGETPVDIKRHNMKKL